MSSLSKKTKTNSNTTSTSELTDWSKNEKATREADILGSINNFNASARPTYSGATVADMSPDEVQAREMARSSTGRAPVDYRMFDQFDAGTYMNPYERDVVDATGAYIDENLTKSINDNSLRATSNGAYGGSRHGVADAELMRTAGMDKAAKMAELRYQGYNDAADRFERDSGNKYQADTRNSDVAYQDNLKKIDMLSQLGASEREIEQAKLLAAKAQYDEASADEWKRFQLEMGAKLGFYQSTPMLLNNKGTFAGTTKNSDPLGEAGSVLKLGQSAFDLFGNVFGPKT